MFRTMTALAAAAAICCALGTSTAEAQKGMGDQTGVARQATLPDVVTLKGSIREVDTGPCDKTTGRSTVGTHVVIETRKGDKLNVHLGPAADVADVARRLTVGERLSVRAFRTEKMPENHYVAQVLRIDDETVRLRDDSLRPVWAGGRGNRAGQGGQQAAPSPRYRQQPQYGAGDGRGMNSSAATWTCPRWGGPPQGRGPGRGQAARGGAGGRGPGAGLGPGAGNGGGRGAAMGGRGGGRGQGQGAGQGRGQGAGQGRRYRHRAAR